MAISANIAARIAGAKPSQSGNIIKPGKYIFEVERMIYMPQGSGSGQSFKGEMWIAELRVLESTATGDVDHRNGAAIIPNAPGSTASYVINLTKMRNGAGDIKAFLMALLGEPDEAITGEIIQAACSDEQPFQYLKIRDEAWNKPQKADPSKTFTRHKWETIIPSAADLKASEARKIAVKAAR